MHVSLSLLIPFLTGSHASTRVLFPRFYEISQQYTQTGPQGPGHGVKSCVTGDFFHFDKSPHTSYVLPFLTQHPQVLASTSLIAIGTWITHDIFTQPAFIQWVPRSVRTTLNITLIKAGKVASDHIHVALMVCVPSKDCSVVYFVFSIAIQFITVINSNPFSIEFSIQILFFYL